jgi:hypothetical protein
VALTPKEYDLLAFLTEEPGALMVGYSPAVGVTPDSLRAG